MSALGALALSAAAAAPICTDRPAKANSVCTVPAGRWQIESSVVSWSLSKAAGTRTTALTVAPTTAKLGLTDTSDLQVSVTRYARARVRGKGSVSGTSDVVLRYKHRLTGTDAPIQVSVIPFVKIPTAARDLGNKKIEGGLAVPASFVLAGSLTVAFGPEVDLLADASGSGRHVAIVNVVNIAGPVARRLTIVGELWST